ncbi:ABC transporter ATP-binding protein [Neobacillus sp. NRS-1170]|uniref:ABC transporter ATP-binding protein n=1 Tax=Neobacillus sp. NRS-1170 TaxID=3233898 RepID=UPI003D2BBB68
MLTLSNVHVYYGHVHALKGVSITVEDGKIVSLLGSNGAGKSTTLKFISRLIQPKNGGYEVDGKSMLKASPHKVVKSGIIHCPENRRLFPLFTVEENLRMGAFSRRDKNIKEDLERVFSYFPRIKERIKQKAGTLSGGEQQMLAIGRSLMAKPKVLLLDEPSLGIAPILVKEIFAIIKKINQDGTSILLVEQNANMALSVSDYAYVLENGNIALEGSSQVLRNNDEVRRLYLGG